MSHYLLSVHTAEPDEAAAEAAPMTPEQLQSFMEAIEALEADMTSAGVFVFGGKLHDPDTATVVRPTGSGQVMTDGPFAESKEHLGGFYLIKAEDLDGALEWASRVVDVIGVPLEVRPFADQRSG